MNSNPEIFDEPEIFRPERWLGEKGKQLKEWEIAFSKGRYNCIGARYKPRSLFFSSLTNSVYCFHQAREY
jgi:cytochrome P450